MEILVFKTSVCSQQQVNKLMPLLGEIENIVRWNFDLEDCDRILRIVAGGLNPKQVELTLQQAGFRCIEFTD